MTCFHGRKSCRTLSENRKSNEAGPRKRLLAYRVLGMERLHQDSFVGHRICGRARTCEKKRRYPSDISSFSHLIESTRRRRTSGGRSPATTGAERRHSNSRPSPWQGDTPPLSHSCIGNIPSKPHIELHQPLNLHLTFLDKPSTD